MLVAEKSADDDSEVSSRANEFEGVEGSESTAVEEEDAPTGEDLYAEVPAFVRILIWPFTEFGPALLKGIWKGGNFVAKVIDSLLTFNLNYNKFTVFSSIYGVIELASASILALALRKADANQTNKTWFSQMLILSNVAFDAFFNFWLQTRSSDPFKELQTAERETHPACYKILDPINVPEKPDWNTNEVLPEDATL